MWNENWKQHFRKKTKYEYQKGISPASSKEKTYIKNFISLPSSSLLKIKHI